jgi:hypothetical protein
LAMVDADPGAALWKDLLSAAMRNFVGLVDEDERPEDLPMTVLDEFERPAEREDVRAVGCLVGVGHRYCGVWWRVDPATTHRRTVCWGPQIPTLTMIAREKAPAISSCSTHPRTGR